MTVPEPASDEITLHPAMLEDCLRLWELRNEKTTRKVSFSEKFIPFEEHERWLISKLADPYTCILIVKNTSGRSVGYVRFDVVDEEAEINISIDRAEREKGYGLAAIKSGTKYIQKVEAVVRVIAHIRLDNTASMVAFKRAGFVFKRYKQIEGVDSCEMIWEGKRADR